MAKVAVNLQDSFLNQVRKDNTLIKIVLLDGTRLEGHVRGFDNFTVVINCHGAQHLIYKHAVAQIINDHKVVAAEAAAGAAAESAEAGERPPSPRPRGDRRPGEQRHGDQRHGKPRETAPPPKFNTLDLSSVQVEPAEEAK